MIGNYFQLHWILFSGAGIVGMILLYMRWQAAKQNEYTEWANQKTVKERIRLGKQSPEDAFDCINGLFAEIGVKVTPDRNFIALMDSIINPEKKKTLWQHRSNPFVKNAIGIALRSVGDGMKAMGHSHDYVKREVNEKTLMEALRKFKDCAEKIQTDRKEDVSEFMAQAAQRGYEQARRKETKNAGGFTDTAVKKVYTAIAQVLDDSEKFNPDWTEEECFSKIREGSIRLGITIGKKGQLIGFNRVFMTISGKSGVEAGNESTCRKIMQVAFGLKKHKHF